jgi:hypothetical protein
VGATTRAGMLTNPLRDRFGIVSRLEFYTAQELAYIVSRSARLLDVEIDDTGAFEIARRARGTPRIANRLLRRVRDYAEVRADGRITAAVADAALTMLDVDHLGLDLMDRKLLGAMLEKFGGGPVGLDNLAAAIGESSDTIEDVLEPYLIQQGYLQRTPRGRMATASIWQHFGLKPPGGGGACEAEVVPAGPPARRFRPVPASRPAVGGGEESARFSSSKGLRHRPAALAVMVRPPFGSRRSSRAGSGGSPCGARFPRDAGGRADREGVAGAQRQPVEIAVAAGSQGRSRPAEAAHVVEADFTQHDGQQQVAVEGRIEPDR